jgi:hypothetical protein
MITTPFLRETLSLLSYHPILNNALEFTQTTTLRFPNPWFACEMQNKLLVNISYFVHCCCAASALAAG